jgi:outer membrane lipoprotein SlyB
MPVAGNLRGGPRQALDAARDRRSRANAGDLVMTRRATLTALLTAAALGGCAVAPPSGPSVMALPAQGKNFEQFQQDDGTCRQYASAQIGNLVPAQAGSQSFVNSAAAGTVLGAAAGAAIGAATGNPAAGAAIGAGSGLFLGGATGAGAASYSSSELQRRYDMGYLQCMSAKGESVPSNLGSYGSYPATYGYGYGYGSPYPYYYPYYYPSGFVGTTFVFGGGFHHHPFR